MGVVNGPKLDYAIQGSALGINTKWNHVKLNRAVSRINNVKLASRTNGAFHASYVGMKNRRVVLV